LVKAIGLAGDYVKSRGHGFTLIELMIVIAIILILSALTVPHLLRSKIQANETSALGILTTLNNSLFDYWTNYDCYPPSLSGLSSAEALLAVGPRGGYVFTYSAGPADSKGVSQSYMIKGIPISVGITGRRYFFTDQTGLIRAGQSDASTATGSVVN
jgi:type IV pilus assembly protein PilA